MPADYTVIFQTRQWFGDRSNAGDEHVVNAIDTEFKTAPYVGVSKDYNFDCPLIDPTQEGVLHFIAYGLGFGNIIQINGFSLYGGLSYDLTYDKIQVNGYGFGVWHTHELIVNKNVLHAANNILHLESVAKPYSGGRNDFIIDNFVLFYKMHSSIVVNPGGVVAENASENKQ